MKITIPFAILSLVFVVSYLVTCLLEVKVLDLWGFAVTGGFFVVPIAYIVNDCIVEIYGYKLAKYVLWATFITNSIVAIILQLACIAPYASYWDGQEHFQYIFQQSPRVAIAAMLAFIFATTTNARIMDWMKIHCEKLGFKVRAIVSTIFGESVDALVFFPIVFYGILTWNEIFVMIVSTTIGKCCYEALILPITSRIVTYVKKIETNE